MFTSNHVSTADSFRVKKKLEELRSIGISQKSTGGHTKMIDEINMMSQFKYGYKQIYYHDNIDMIEAIRLGDQILVFDSSKEAQDNAWELTRQLYLSIL